MKRFLNFLLIVLSAFTVTAQNSKSVKLYGYLQPVVKGVSPKKTVTEDNREIYAQPKPSANIFIYLSYPPNAGLQPEALYIDGKKFTVKSTTITQTPVVIKDNNLPLHPKTTVLVPQTNNTVLLITPAESVNFKPGSCLKKKMKNNEVVVSYTVKGKRKYATLSKLTRLEPAVLQ